MFFYALLIIFPVQGSKLQNKIIASPLSLEIFKYLFTISGGG